MTVALVTTSDVRAVLGVSAKELTDAVLSSQIYSIRLREDLIEMHPQIVSDFATIGALTTPTDDQERFIDLTKAYAAYNVANQCTASLPMFSPLTIKDEKAELTRNANFYATLKADIADVMAVLARKLKAAYAKVNASAPVAAAADPIYAVAVGLSTDPVTGS